jgi:phenylalanyl-tRNA synthetase alpha chain
MIDVQDIKQQFASDLAEVKTLEHLEAVRIKYLGRKQGLVTQAFGQLAMAPVDQKREYGPALNELKQEIESLLTQRGAQFSDDEERIDLTLPPQERSVGHLHPVTQVQHELEEIFHNLGFATVFSQEIESDWHNFTALNMPPNHPARDMQDTFYVKREKGEPVVLRTQTSSGQIRFMQEHKPPFSIIIPGRVYRNEATDATHEHTFQQMEGLVVGKNITYANMIWLLERVLTKFFGPEAKIKVLPSYFPFVEPGAEVAISHPKFKNGKWLELLGCGMVHQNVFEAVGYKRNEYQGFAFGFGLTRFALMKYMIPDIRLLSENNIHFLKQF